MTSLINSYINNFKHPISPQNTNTGKMVNTNVEELDTRNYLKPLPGNGRLVKNNIFEAPAVMVKDTIYDLKALNHSIKGKANDHELGKINDLGMKLGGLAIAAYLMTKRNSPMTKAMEFIGLGSFFASMAIWPKVAIQLPAYLIHGVNTRQKYVDNYGRKKLFSQDPQFLPWDLYSEQKIYKTGDRMGVPKNIPNRRDFIQAKEKKIFIQSNTLWMLTAGFATPIMSALICNQLEKPVQNMLDNINSKRADNLLTKFTENVNQANKHQVTNRINSIIELNKGQVIDKKLFNEILGIFSEGYGPVTKDGIEKDLNKILYNNKYEINHLTIENLLAGIKKHLKNTQFANIGTDIIPAKAKFIEEMTKRNIIGHEYHENDLSKVSDEIINMFLNNIKEHNKAHPEAPINWHDFANVLNNTMQNTSGPIAKGLKTTPASRMTASVQAQLHELSHVFDELNATRSVLGKYAFMKVGSAPETTLANYWNNTADKIIDIFGIKPEEIKKTRFDRELVYKLIREKITDIAASDDETYKKFMAQMGEAIAPISDILKIDDSTFGVQQGKPAGFAGVVDSKIDVFIDKLNNDKIKMPNFIRRLIGIEYYDYAEDGKTLVKKVYTGGTYKNVLKRFVSDRMLGVESSMLRLVNTIDVMRNIAKDQNVMQLHNGYCQEIKEELLEAAIKTLFQDHTSDFATKGYMKRNPNPKNAKEVGNIFRKAQRVIYQIFGKTPSEQMVDLPMDAGFFQEKMKLCFNNPVGAETRESLPDSVLKKLEAYKKNVMEYLADDYCFYKPHHNVGFGKQNISAKFKFNICGIALDEFFYNVFNQKFNTNKWFKIFGGFFAGLTAVTVGSQFFFGKMKVPETTQKG